MIGKYQWDDGGMMTSVEAAKKCADREAITWDDAGIEAILGAGWPPPRKNTFCLFFSSSQAIILWSRMIRACTRMIILKTAIILDSGTCLLYRHHLGLGICGTMGMSSESSIMTCPRFGSRSVPRTLLSIAAFHRCSSGTLLIG